MKPLRFLPAMHTGGRRADDIDASGVLLGYATIVRDGYAGYTHLTDANTAAAAARAAGQTTLN